VTDSSQNVVWSTRYQPFGTTPTPTGSITQNLRLPGQYSDAETGFNYNYFRDYMPSLGRYLESDPIGLAGGLNTYLYANANAGRFTDPNGLRTNINLYPWGSPQWISAENTATLSNVFVVAGHGNEESLAGLDADELADMILDHLGQDYIPGERILLLSCKTGVKEPGQTLNAQMSPIAQLLANILGAEVDAPNDFIWMYQNGTYAVAPPSIFGGPGPSLGRFLPFYPRISDNSVVR
jgi:RHS repeat-associated protein